MTGLHWENLRCRFIKTEFTEATLTGICMVFRLAKCHCDYGSRWHFWFTGFAILIVKGPCPFHY